MLQPHTLRRAIAFGSSGNATLSQRLQASRRLPINRHTLQGRRNFSVAIWEHGVSGFSSVYETLGQAGLPWYLAIPLVSIGIGFTCRLPALIFAARHASKQRELKPVFKAWLIYHRNKAMLSFNKSETIIEADRKAHKLAEANYAVSERRVKQAFGVQGWKTWSTAIVTLIPSYIAGDALRRVSGLPTFWSIFPWNDLIYLPIDQSLIEGGCLWFTNLTAPDPYYILPLSCTVLVFWQIFRNKTLQEMKAIFKVRQDASLQSLRNLVRERLISTIPFLTLMMIPIPSALVLHILTGMVFSSVTRAILDRRAKRRIDAFENLSTVVRAAPSYIRGSSRA